jgi:hypothetical protein
VTEASLDGPLGERARSHQEGHGDDDAVEEAEASTLGLSGDALQAAARTRALERGDHLLSARYPCRACHGQNFGGGVMVDDAMLGHFLAPNLTTGKDSRTVKARGNRAAQLRGQHAARI